MNCIPVKKAHGVPGQPSCMIEVSMTSKYYEYLITDLFLRFSAPHIERCCGLIIDAKNLERLAWERLSSIMTIL